MLSLTPEHSFCQFQWPKCCHFPERLIGILRLQLQTALSHYQEASRYTVWTHCHYFQLQRFSVPDLLTSWPAPASHNQTQLYLLASPLSLAPIKQCQMVTTFPLLCHLEVPAGPKGYFSRGPGQSSLLLPEVTSEKDKISPWKLDSGLGVIARACCSPLEHKQFHRSVSLQVMFYQTKTWTFFKSQKWPSICPILTNLSDCCLFILYSSYSVDVIKIPIIPLCLFPHFLTASIQNPSFNPLTPSPKSPNTSSDPQISPFY